MSTIDTQSLMLQMRSLAAQAASKPNEPMETAAQSGQEKADNFAELLTNSVNAVNAEQHKSGDMKKAFERGDLDVELSEVMLQAQKASLSFQAMTQVRNKLTEAYKDIMNMPI
ncbi:MAG: flagellar hook-basal body complex protein FliE [Thiomicrorhabdus chilensis]|uniref:flagellar hook-basal body complex protein FliE n=1 Tax=Thiomicrorhabdus chilensis TaxID=63656 RepID=UPI00048DED1B|nr:flagellar hook-basal body complex protein FliE [Thiomicrorhabdus chilensis]MDX1346921.1 flagellar hook-basal body complex protein FliE [Thiomicrorhabdus chilensis]